MKTLRTTAYMFLCLVPLLSLPFVGLRYFRVPGLYPWFGLLYFAAIAVAAWLVGGRALAGRAAPAPQLALAGLLFLVPTLLHSLLWFGLGTPWDATPEENRMRYIVLVTDTVAITSGFFLLQRELADAGIRVSSTLALALAALAGVSYLFWNSFYVGIWVLRLRDGHHAPAGVAVGDILDALLFFACILTYAATLLFAVSLHRAQWISRGGAAAYVLCALTAIVLLVLRGLSYPDPTASATPWFVRPAFIIGIPAIPWVMPYFFGIRLLQRAAIETRTYLN